jgi:hypothetical protein
MFTKLENLATLLDNNGQGLAAEMVRKLSKRADFSTADFSSLRIDDPRLEKWETLYLAIDKPSELVYEIKLSKKPLEEASADLSKWKDKFGMPVTDAQRGEVIQALSKVTPSGLEKRSILYVSDNEWENYLLEDKVAEKKKIKPKFWGRALPVAGALISVGLASKNISEAIHNSKVIINKLPLSKYGLSTVKIFSPAVPLVGRAISKQIDENKDNPDNLLELLEICKVLSAFYIDLLLAITNSAMLIIDILTLISVFLDGPLPIADAIAGLIGFVLSMGLIGVELGTEYLSHKYWERYFHKIKEIALENITEIEQSHVAGAVPA